MLTDPNPDDPLVPEIAHVSFVYMSLRSARVTNIADLQDGPFALRGHGSGMDPQVSIGGRRKEKV